MKIEKTESLFNNGKEYLTIVEGITQDDVIVKTSQSEKNVDRAVDAKYSFDRSLWMSVYVVFKPETVEVLKSINPQLLKCVKLSQAIREEKESYNMHETHRLEFKFTGIRTRKKKIEKYDGIYEAFIKDIPRLTDLFTNKLLDIINDYLKGQVSDINEKYTRNHVELFTDDTYEYAWKEEFIGSEELVKAQKEKEDLAKQIAELNSKMTSLNSKITKVKCDITKKSLSEEELPSEVVDKINEKYTKGEAWRIYGTRRGLRLS
jgi:hypothetical protein